MKVLYLDESGDHNLKIIDPAYPVFVLGGVIVDETYANGALTSAFDEFKRGVLGRTDIVLHTADIARNRNGFEHLGDAELRRSFYSELNLLMQQLDYEVVACAILKDYYLDRYGPDAIDLYRLGLHVAVEQLCDALGTEDVRGTIVAEKRGETLDQDVQDTWEKLNERGSRYAEAEVIRNKLLGLELRDKKENIAGLQLADLVVSPIGRHVLGKQDREDWHIVQRKLLRSPERSGLIVLPMQ